MLLDFYDPDHSCTGGVLLARCVDDDPSCDGANALGSEAEEIASMSSLYHRSFNATSSRDELRKVRDMTSELSLIEWHPVMRKQLNAPGPLLG